ncbi:uncharacterized protein LOC128875139 [Hylaeus volcanicus]|uniref:uncharacterized protein LOC128875139 n=1 Tax=Hylaeus volcanicus TaxID=313075 RepID=UPI0023B8703D|nr:uncharacterized protein LOC128875139 [Hylaeus volcanicus]
MANCTDDELAMSAISLYDDNEENKTKKRKWVKNSENHRNEQSSGKVNDDNSAALNRFLEDVLNAQNDFKWIDKTVRNVNNGKDAEKSPSESSHLKGIPSSVNVHRDSKLREKRGSDHNFETMWMPNRKIHEHHTSSEHPRRVFLDRDMAFKRNADLDASDKPHNGVNEKESPSSLRSKGAMDDRVSKDWSRTEDICSLSDWLNSNKEPETEEEKLGDRWIRDHETGQGNQPSMSYCFKHLSNSGKDGDVRYSARNQRNEAKKEEAPSLETLKETVLELRKSLDQPFEKVHDNLKNVDSEKVKGESKDRRTRDKNKHKKKENEYQDSDWWETPEPDVFDAKRSEHSSGNPDDKNAQQKMWRTKRTEVNNDDVNPRLFYRAGFGEPYLEEKTLKELHDRKRRSKGSPSDEERYSNEPRDENNPQTDAKNSIKNSIKIARVTSYDDVNDSSGKQSAMNYFRGNRASYAGTGKNDEQSDPSRGNLNTVENKWTRHGAKGGNLEGGSSRTFGSATNELQPVFTGTSGSGLSADGRDEVAAARTQKTEEQQENTGTGKGEQVIKVSEPQGRLYEDSERTKEVQRIASNERGKLSQQLLEEKRSVKESGNINILLKSEKKNLIKFSNENTLGGEQQPFVLNRFDVKKKLIVENEEEPGKSVSTILKMKIEKARVDGSANTGRKREDVEKDDDGRHGSDAFDLGKSKPNEESYKESVGFMKELKQRNSAEERFKSSAEFDKGSAQSGKGPRNWYEGVPGDQMVVSVEHDAAERCKEEDERDKFRNEEERFRDDAKKGESVGSNDETASKDSSFSVLEDKVKDYEGGNGKKYKEVFILADGAGDRKINDRYAQRKILQYMEYSNDDVEDADLNYSDKEAEEGENQERAETDEENSVPGQRKQRSPQSGRRNPVKAKLNVMIKEKLDKKKSERRYKRKRRNPVDIIQYYDYDSDNQEQDDGALSAINDQERVKNNNDKNGVESNVDLGNNACASQSSNIKHQNP